MQADDLEKCPSKTYWSPDTDAGENFRAPRAAAMAATKPENLDSGFPPESGSGKTES